MKTIIILLFLVAVTVSGIWVIADEAADFKKFAAEQQQDLQQVNNDFNEFRKELEDEFAAYKQLYEDEFNAYKKTILKQWGEFKSGDKDTWITYDKTGIRNTVDFSKGDITVEVLVDSKQAEERAKKRLRQMLAAILKTTEKTAFKQDVVAQKVEEKLPTVSTNVKQGTPSERMVMAPLFPSLSTPSEQKVEKLTSELMNKAKTDSRQAKVEGKKIVRLKVNTPVNVPKKAKRFEQTVNKRAKKEELPVPLVLAVMETESAFNPMAKSHIPAYGLMQIVPKSAGKDASAYLFGKAQLLAPSYLYNSDNNIMIGSAYLHILYYRYLKSIKDPVSRLYCTIASYNTGAGNVARAFTGRTNMNKAAKEINKLTPKEVYQKLRNDLPYEETQHYLKKVSLRMQQYQQKG